MASLEPDTRWDTIGSPPKQDVTIVGTRAQRIHQANNMRYSSQQRQKEAQSKIDQYYNSSAADQLVLLSVRSIKAILDGLQAGAVFTTAIAPSGQDIMAKMYPRGLLANARYRIQRRLRYSIKDSGFDPHQTGQYYLIATMLHVIAAAQDVPHCYSCQQEGRRFKECRLVPGHFNSACTNCIAQGTFLDCTYATRSPLPSGDAGAEVLLWGKDGKTYQPWGAAQRATALASRAHSAIKRSFSKIREPLALPQKHCPSPTPSSPSESSVGNHSINSLRSAWAEDADHPSYLDGRAPSRQGVVRHDGRPVQMALEFPNDSWFEDIQGKLREGSHTVQLIVNYTYNAVGDVSNPENRERFREEGRRTLAILAAEFDQRLKSTVRPYNPVQAPSGNDIGKLPQFKPQWQAIDSKAL